MGTSPEALSLMLAMLCVYTSNGMRVFKDNNRHNDDEVVEE
jgi:hypothetical protein